MNRSVYRSLQCLPQSFRALTDVCLACESVSCEPGHSHTNRTFTLLSASDKLNTAGRTFPWSLARVSQTWSPHCTECLQFPVFVAAVFVLTGWICHTGGANWRSWELVSDPFFEEILVCLSCIVLTQAQKRAPAERMWANNVYTWKISFMLSHTKLCPLQMLKGHEKLHCCILYSFSHFSIRTKHGMIPLQNLKDCNPKIFPIL